METKTVYLTSLSEKEAMMIKNLLEAENIPVLIKHRESGGYASIYMGMSAYDVELYVAADDYEKANNIISDLEIEIDDEEMIEQAESDSGLSDSIASSDANDKQKDKTIFNSFFKIGKLLIIIYLIYIFAPLVIRIWQYLLSLI